MAEGAQSDKTSSSPLDSEYTIGYSDEVAGFFGARRATSHAAFLLPYLAPGMSVLDAGCGPGSITIDLAELVRPGEVIGVDIEASQIALARQAVAQRGVRNVRFEHGSLYALPFASKRFDAVFLHGVVEHLKDPLSAILEVRRVLKAGGVLGMRNGDWGGFLFAPLDSPALLCFEIIQKLMLDTGGDPHCGRNQLALLQAAGFRRILASASFDCWTRTPEMTRQIGAFFAAHCRTPEFEDRAVALGLVDIPGLEQMELAFREWGQNPAAFAAEAWGEVVAWNE